MVLFGQNKPATDAQPKRRSVLGLLFNPQLGPAISPFRESTAHFLQTLAMVFSVYGLLPKNYAELYLKSGRALSLRGVIGDAWQNVHFTREGASRAILFFAVIFIIGFSGLMAVAALFSLFVGHAHAQTAASSTSMFTAPSTDIAQKWMDYLFVAPGGAAASFPTASDTYGSITANLEDPFSGSVSLQSALMTALAYYSDAILVVAAFILFYHLASMVVETAHHGEVMGKRASQIWAPIRLVVAIGLLVPINGGLSSGQYIVIKVAEMGSAVASNIWAGFLTQLASYAGQPVSPPAPIVAKIASDMIDMQACQISWQYHIAEYNKAGLSISAADIVNPKQDPSATLGDTPGTKYMYSSNSINGQNVCGWYFVPSGQNVDGAVTTNGLLQDAAQAHQQAITSSNAAFQTAAKDMNVVIENPGVPLAAVQPNTHFQDAVAAYQQNVNNAIQALGKSQTASISQAVQTITPYGWVMAGTFLNTIARVQADLASAARDTMPTTSPPNLIPSGDPSDVSVYSSVAKDMVNFNQYVSSNLESKSNKADAACDDMVNSESAASLGLGRGKLGHYASNKIDELFKIVDRLAVASGVWSSGTGKGCGNSTNGVQGFKLGIQINGRDPLSQMVALGFANLNTAFGLAESAAVGDGLTAMIQSGMKAASSNGQSAVGDAAGQLGGAAASMALFFALIFFAGGFSLAFLIPLMPFMRFFFAVLAWVAAIVEAVIQVPLIALAHINPEGDGLPGQSAQGAYFFVFNIFLRPLLCIFGLICGLVLFMMAVSFLNYGYAIAVSGIGGSTYGLATMSKIIYTILYVVLLYTSANQSFMLIDHLPENALRWMGQSGQAIPKMGDTGQIEQAGTLVSSYVGQQGMQKIGEAAKGVGGAIGSGVGGLARGLSPSHEVPGAISRDADGNMISQEFSRGKGSAALAGAVGVGLLAAGGGAAAWMASEGGNGIGAQSGEKEANLRAISDGARDAKMSPAAFMQNDAQMKNAGLGGAIRDQAAVNARVADIAELNQNSSPPQDGGDNGGGGGSPPPGFRVG